MLTFVSLPLIVSFAKGQLFHAGQDEVAESIIMF